MRYFVDTSAWIALADRTDQWHANAEGWWRKNVRLEDRFVSTLSVFSETVSVIRGRVSAEKAILWGEDIRRSGRVDLLHEPREFHDQAWKIFRKYRDWKRLSYVDCLSFAAMEENLLTVALAFDDHFSAYGFQVVPGKSLHP